MKYKILCSTLLLVLLFVHCVFAEPPEDYITASAVIDMEDNPFYNSGNFHIFYGQTQPAWEIFSIDTEIDTLYLTPNGEEQR